MPTFRRTWRINLTNKELKNYGGQALIEGILMRGKKYVVAAFRKPDGKIHIESEKLTGIYKSRYGQMPFIRGLVILWDSLSLGIKYLTISANLQTEEEEKIEGPALLFSLTISITFAALFFFVLPSLLIELLKNFFIIGPTYVNIIEGILRLILLVSYIWLIGFSKDIARVFGYHGAEHKTINAYENGEQLNLDNISKYPVAHARCGTSFLLTLVVISIVIFSLLGELSFFMRIVSRIAAIPFLSMIAYEIIRWLGSHQENPIVRIITTPNLLIQNLTTREPEPDMIEIALYAFNKLLELEEQV